jgi:hypothetical protein
MSASTTAIPAANATDACTPDATDACTRIWLPISHTHGCMCLCLPVKALGACRDSVGTLRVDAEVLLIL